MIELLMLVVVVVVARLVAGKSDEGQSKAADKTADAEVQMMFVYPKTPPKKKAKQPVPTSATEEFRVWCDNSRQVDALHQLLH